jgi:hypothetical protein
MLLHTDGNSAIASFPLVKSSVGNITDNAKKKVPEGTFSWTKYHQVGFTFYYANPQK